MAEIRFDELSKWYGEKEPLHVLDNISSHIRDQEFIVIVGPSGCGKTTLLKMVAGLVPPSEGGVYFNDEEITDPRPEIAMVFQTFQLLPWRTVINNVALGLEIQGVHKEDRHDRAQHWLDIVGIDGFEDSYPHELSGGMKQRVGLARALVVDPDVLLMDEPFGALDAQTRDRMQSELLQLMYNREKTTIFITHDVREAIFLADRVFVLSEKPATIEEEYVIDIPRPRYENRVEIESSEKFAQLEKKIREKLGLVMTEDEEVTAD